MAYQVETSKIEPQYIGIKDVCEITGLGETLVREHIALGRLRASRVGRIFRIRRDDIHTWMENQTAA